MKNLVILGAGGFAREVAWLVGDINRENPMWNLLGFVDKGSKTDRPTLLNCVPVFTEREVSEFISRGKKIWAVVAVGRPKLREKIVEQMTRSGILFATLIHPSVLYDKETIRIGGGSVICAGNILTTNIEIGCHVHVNLDSTIGHDCRIADYATISPGCHLSGYTFVGRRAYLGTGVVTVEGHAVGEDSIIGAGAVITRDIPPSKIAVGVPAKPIKEVE